MAAEKYCDRIPPALHLIDAVRVNGFGNGIGKHGRCIYLSNLAR
jgi:hypothetical protein